MRKTGDRERAVLVAVCLDRNRTASESSLAKDWLRPEEDEVWKDL